MESTRQDQSRNRSKEQQNLGCNEILQQKQYWQKLLPSNQLPVIWAQQQQQQQGCYAAYDRLQQLYYDQWVQAEQIRVYNYYYYYYYYHWYQQQIQQSRGQNQQHYEQKQNLPSSEQSRNHETLASFLDCRNSFLTPWCWNLETPNTGERRRMEFQPGSFFSYEIPSMRPKEDSQDSKNSEQS